MHDLDFDLKNESMSNVSRPNESRPNESRPNVSRSNESPYTTCYLMAIVIFTLSVIISKVFSVEIYMTLTLTFRFGQGQM